MGLETEAAIWQTIYPKHWLRYSNWIQQESVPNFTLWLGPPGSGKRSLAKSYFQLLLCLNPTRTADGLFSCLRCSSCLQLVNGKSIDGITLEEKFTVDEARSLSDHLGRPPLQSMYRVIFMPRLHLISSASANALLKILEEPPNSWRFVATADEAGSLPKTILSRAFIEKIPFLNTQSLRTLQSAYPDIAIDIGHGEGNYYFAAAIKELPDVEPILQGDSQAVFLALEECQKWGTEKVKYFLLKIIHSLHQKIIEQPTNYKIWTTHFERLVRSTENLELPLNKKLLFQACLLPFLETPRLGGYTPLSNSATLPR